MPFLNLNTAVKIKAFKLACKGHGFKSRTGLNFFSGPIFNYSFQ